MKTLTIWYLWGLTLAVAFPLTLITMGAQSLGLEGLARGANRLKMWIARKHVNPLNRWAGAGFDEERS